MNLIALIPRFHSGEGATIISENIEEYRRPQIRQNSPQKGGKVWSHDKQFLVLLRCSTMLFDCPEIKSQQRKKILRIPYELVEISGDFTTITCKLTTGRGE